MKRFYGLAGGLALAGTASAALLLSDATTTGTGTAATSAIANWVSLGSPLQATRARTGGEPGAPDRAGRPNLLLREMSGTRIIEVVSGFPLFKATVS